LHVDSWGLGLLRSAPAVGALLVSLYLARFPIRRKVGKIMFGSVACTDWRRWCSPCRVRFCYRWRR